jgi:predicted HicB family RNase H-like nuclease
MTDNFAGNDRKRETKSQRINLRLKPSVLRVIQDAADRDNRPLSQWVEKLLRDHVEKTGTIAA